VVPKRYPLRGPVARSLEVVGDRWTLLLIRELLVGPAGYAELARRLVRIPTNLLADRLRLLEEEDIVGRDHQLAYQLTAKGRDLAPVLAGLAAWGLRHYGELPSALATHAGCGGRVTTRSVCCDCHRPVDPDDLELLEVNVDTELGGDATRG
jgi:DNA-binding HxlR family transcriptional regulator